MSTLTGEEKISAFAVAQIKDHQDKQPLSVGKPITVQAGILQELPTGFKGEPIILPSQEGEIPFQVMIYAQDMNIESERIQPFLFCRDKDSPLVEFILRPTQPGSKRIRVEFLKENTAISWPFMAAIVFGLVAALFIIIYFGGGLRQAGRADDAALALLPTNMATPTGTRIFSDVIPTTDTFTPTSTQILSVVTPTAFTPITTDTSTPLTGTRILSPVTSTAFAPITTGTPTPISTLMPTETPAPTSIPTAVALESAIIFRAPDTRTRELDRVLTDETVEVLGRSADRFGRVENKPGLYIRTSEGIEGFVVALFFDWPGTIEALPILQPKLAEVIFNGFLLAEPDIASERLAFADEGELVEVLGRSGTDWFYVRTEAGIEGFAQHTYLDWRGDFESLVEQD